MNIVEYVLLIIIAVCLITIWLVAIYNKYQIYVIRINEAEANIDSVLRKRFDLLNKSINIIKAACEDEKDVLEMIVKLRSRKLTNFEFDRRLYESLNEFYKYGEKYPSLKKNENYIKIGFGLSETESEIVAFRKYYNDIITDYNKLVKTFPSNIVAKLCRYEYKTYFDGKEQDDKNIKI